METIEKGFKYRIYPKDNQIEQIENMFNAKRYVYNYFLNINIHRLNHHKSVLNYNLCIIQTIAYKYIHI